MFFPFTIWGQGVEILSPFKVEPWQQKPWISRFNLWLRKRFFCFCLFFKPIKALCIRNAMEVKGTHGFCLGLAEGIWDQKTQELRVWAHVSGGDRDICAQTPTCLCVCVCVCAHVHAPIAEMTGAEGGKGSSHFKKVTLSLRQWEISKGILAKSGEVRLGSHLWGWLFLFLPLLTFPYICFALLLSLTQSSNFFNFYLFFSSIIRF